MPYQHFLEGETIHTLKRDQFITFITAYGNTIRGEYLKFNKKLKTAHFVAKGNRYKYEHGRIYEMFVSIHQMEKLERMCCITERQLQNHRDTIYNRLWRLCCYDFPHEAYYTHYKHFTAEFREKDFAPLEKVYFIKRLEQEEKEARKLVGDKVIKEYINKQKEEFAKCCKKLQIGESQLPEVLEEKILEYVE